MARGGFSRRRRPMSLKLVAILAGVGLLGVVGALFFLASQADSRRPAQEEVSIPATNIGPEANPVGGSDAPTQ